MLAVYKAVVIFSVLGSVRHGHLNVITLQVDDGVKAFAVHIVIEEVDETVARDYLVAVEVDDHTRIEVRVVFHHALNVLGYVMKVAEHGFIRHEDHLCAVLFLSFSQGLIPYQLPAPEFNLLKLAVTE